MTALHMAGPPRRALGKRRAADRSQSRRWGWLFNLIGVGVSKKIVEGKASGPLCLTFYVRRKFPKSRLAKNQIVPSELQLRALGGTVLTDLVELPGSIVAHAPDDRVRPLQPGIEVSHVFGPGLGSLCAVVERNGRLFGLGCSHVLARCGIDVTAGSTIEQPHAVSDLNQNSVGDLAADFGTIDFKNPNTEDYALFEIDSGTGTPTNLIAGQNRAISTVDGRTAAQLSALTIETELYGIRTQGQPGSILAPKSSFSVRMLKPDMTHANATFTKVVAYHTPCQEGDSGGAVMEKATGNLLGMHFAGGPGFGLFLPAGPLFENHGLKLFA
jgi:hypothetical protein